MIWLALLLSLSGEPRECPRVEWPELPVPTIDGMPAPLPMRTCEPSTGVAALMYAVGIDAAEPVQSEELDADIYEEVTP